MGRHRRLAGTRPNTLTCIPYDLREREKTLEGPKSRFLDSPPGHRLEGACDPNLLAAGGRVTR
ncbi:hypothetical protein Acsp01_33380 [Actinoplanes sp. NBRC 101535]|nr:hypothetical protein Acsp01_33380 [Actinoplanes sp. NBRC 101535]